MSKTPAISICLPSLNTRPFLEERMETIFGQTFQDWELIVVDSYSNDGSWEIFRRYASDPRVRLIQSPRRGLYAGWNESLALARGEYIYVATSDDTASPDLLERLIEAVGSFPEVSLAMCDFQAIDAASRPIEFTYHGLIEEFYAESLRRHCVRDGKTEFLLMSSLGGPSWTTMTSVLFRRSLLDKIGSFPTNRGSGGDFEWALRAALVTDFIFIPGRLATWRLHEGQASNLAMRDPRQVRRRRHDCLVSVLRNYDAMIPTAWKRIDGWDRIISGYHRKLYYDLCGLYRSTFLRDPAAFARNVYYAARNDPRLLLSRAACLFNGRDRFLQGDNSTRTSVDYFRHLTHLFGTPWPPLRIEALPKNW